MSAIICPHCGAGISFSIKVDAPPHRPGRNRRLDREAVRQLLDKRIGPAEIAAKLGMARSSVYLIKKELMARQA